MNNGRSLFSGWETGTAPPPQTFEQRQRGSVVKAKAKKQRRLLLGANAVRSRPSRGRSGLLWDGRAQVSVGDSVLHPVTDWAGDAGQAGGWFGEGANGEGDHSAWVVFNDERLFS